MLRSSSKIKMFGALVSLASLPVLSVSSAFATTTTGSSNFRVNVGDALTVSVTTPDTWATGDVDQFLRNHIVVSAVTNSAGGLTAAMYTKTSNTDLINTKKSTYTIPTLSTSVTSKNNFPTNRWGYSISDEEDASDSDTNVLYNPLRGPSSPIGLIEENEPGEYSQDVFFGAKADTTVAAGTYANTVVISVVTGVVDDDETIDDPENPGQDIPNPDYNPMPPVNPSTDNPTPNTATYNPTTNTTTYTTVTQNNDDTTTTTTEVTNGNTANQYTNPQGVSTRKATSTSTEVSDNNALATGLAVTSAVAGATGFIFFIVGKRRKDEDEEEAGGEQQPPIQQ